MHNAHESGPLKEQNTLEPTLHKEIFSAYCKQNVDTMTINMTS